MGQQGVPPAELADGDLLRELRHLYETREEALLDASPRALETHTDRMYALEKEYTTRFPSEPDPDRTREGARARAGQPSGDDGARI